MNIGFIYGLRLFPPGVGGSIHGYQLAKGLVERGHRLFSWYFGDDESPLVEHFRGRQAFQFVRRIDVLYLRVSWSAVMCRFARLRCLRLRHLPVVWELNGLPEEILYNGGSDADMLAANRRLRRFAGGVDAAIGVTPRIRDYLRDTLGVRRAFFISNGSDTDMFAPRQRPIEPHGPLRVVWIGKANCPWHDLDTLLAAAEALNREHANVVFELYGARENLPENLPSNVHCCGVVPYMQLGKQLAQGDVGMACFKRLDDGTLKDGSPLKLFDYMASGLAVVAQDAGQTGQVVRERETGLLTSGSAEDLAAKLMSLEQDRALCRTLGENGHRAAVEYYNWKRVAEETESVLREIVNRRH